MSQEKKAKIAAALKGVVPKDWKYSLAVDNHSTLVFTVSAGPKGPLERPAYVGYDGQHHEAGMVSGAYRQINKYHLDKCFPKGPVLEAAQKIMATINEAGGNYDNSDLMTDYHDVGFYVDFNVGRWNKPFKVIEEKAAE
jgi:hypothetical protein